MTLLRKVAQKLGEAPKVLKFKVREMGAIIKRRRLSAKIVAVTGSSGKTSTVALLTHILEADAKVCAQVLNNKYKHSVNALLAIKPSDKYLVIEQGTSRPGDLDKPARLLKPDIAIVTLVAIEHYSAFRSIDAIAKEKATLVRNLPRSGIAVLNFDDPNVRAMSEFAPGRSVSFGTMGGDYVVGDIATSADGLLSFTLTGRGVSLALRTRLIGKYNWLAVSGAAVCALELGISTTVIESRIASFTPVRGRMSLHEVPGGTKFILDTAKAPNHSLTLPLEALDMITAPKKRFILGQISDYAGNATQKYRDAYAAAAKVADEVCFVGPWVHKARAPAHDVESGKFRAFSEIRELAAHLKETATAGEVIVVKSSQNLHLERLMLDRISEVRCWPNDCGAGFSCTLCGRYEKAFYEHTGRRPHRPLLANTRAAMFD